MILDQKQLEEQKFLEWLNSGNKPIYQETAGKDIGKYKILGYRGLSFDSIDEAKQHYIHINCTCPYCGKTFPQFEGSAVHKDWKFNHETQQTEWQVSEHKTLVCNDCKNK
jgi:hypothetical protein